MEIGMSSADERVQNAIAALLAQEQTTNHDIADRIRLALGNPSIGTVDLVLQRSSFVFETMTKRAQAKGENMPDSLGAGMSAVLLVGLELGRQIGIAAGAELPPLPPSDT